MDMTDDTVIDGLCIATIGGFRRRGPAVVLDVIHYSVCNI